MKRNDKSRPRTKAEKDKKGKLVKAYILFMRVEN